MKTTIKCNCGQRISSRDVMQQGSYGRHFGPSSVSIKFRCSRSTTLGEHFIEETFDAGLELVGTEVKSIRAGKVNMMDAYCRIQNNEVWIHSMHISPFEHGTHWNVEPVRPRKLLLHRREIEYLREKMEQ